MVLWFFFVFFRNCFKLPDDIYSVIKITCRRTQFFKNCFYTSNKLLVYWLTLNISWRVRDSPWPGSPYYRPSTCETLQCLRAPSELGCRIQLSLSPKQRDIKDKINKDQTRSLFHQQLCVSVIQSLPLNFLKMSISEITVTLWLKAALTPNVYAYGSLPAVWSSSSVRSWLHSRPPPPLPLCPWPSMQHLSPGHCADSPTRNNNWYKKNKLFHHYGWLDLTSFLKNL